VICKKNKVIRLGTRIFHEKSNEGSVIEIKKQIQNINNKEMSRTTINIRI
jgi:hypothetical protein